MDTGIHTSGTLDKLSRAGNSPANTVMTAALGGARHYGLPKALLDEQDLKPVL